MTEDDTAQPNRLESLLLNLLFALCSVALLALITVATRPGMATAGWWTRPALAPGLALTLLVGCNVLTLARAIRELRAEPPNAAEWADARTKVIDWVRPLEYLGYFGLYLWLLHIVGYALASLIFVQWLLYRVGLRTGGWRLAGLLIVVGLVLIFRIGLGVWMPAPALYDLLPETLRDYAIRWL